MQTVLVTLGRLPKALDLIRSFHAAGWRVIVADPYADHLVRVSRAVSKSCAVPAPSDEPDLYREALIKIIMDERVDLVVPVSEDILYVSALRDLLPDPVRLLAMPPAIIRAMHDKYEFISRAREIGLAVPATARSADADARDIATRGAFVVKPRHSCAGYGVSMHDRNAPLPDHPDAIVQQAVSGDEFSTCALAHQGRVIGQVVYHSLLQSGTVAIGFERVLHPAIENWVTRFVAATGWSGFIAFDFIVDAQGTPYAIECNPRTTSGLHFFKTGEIAPAILDPARPLGFRRATRLIQFWSVMQHFADHAGRSREMARALRLIWTVRDVTWAWSDPLPLVLMPWTARAIMRAARRDRVPFGIAATRDFVFPPRGSGDAA